MKVRLPLLTCMLFLAAACGSSSTVTPTCGTGLKDCGGACVILARDSANCGACGTVCKAGEQCVEGACAVVCPVGLSLCNGACVATRTDPENCGACGTACAAGEVCAKGACATVCPPGQEACGAACVNVQTDPAHCGECDKACANGQLCAKGACVTSCPAGQTACGSACVSLRYDPDNCGKCGKACGAGEVCNSSQCALVCPAGLTACSGACVNTKSDGQHCGECGKSCPVGETCSNGSCGLVCPAGQTACSGACVNTKNDVANCGQCAKACAATEVCSGGACTSVCPAGQTSCSGACVNTTNDAQNCGQCGKACASGEVCANSTCALVCPAGQTACSGACVNTKNDPANCGKCGQGCNAGEVCSSGACSANCAAGLDPCNGACVSLVSDPLHCGTCTTQCAPSEICSASACVPVCPAGQLACSGACVNPKNDAANCGQCGKACVAGETCQNGACAPFCQFGLNLCAGTCVNLKSDPANCGQCGKDCAAGEVCANSLCASVCSGGLLSCAGACVDVQTDPDNCGQCGNDCANNEVCQAGTCRVVACTSNLYLPITDPWGEAFDGVERGLATYDQARTTCEAMGGRLPTATELWRVGAPMTGGVGQTYTTNHLWTLNPHSTSSQMIIRLSDNNVLNSPIDAGTKRPFRCVCPDVTPTVFDQDACFGPKGSACTQLITEGRRFQMDNYDRAPLPKGSAMWECAFYRGHLVNSVQYVEAISNGLPNGSGNWLHTADDARYNYDIIVKWAGTEPGWAATTSNITVSDLGTFRNFRCMGLSYAPSPYPVSITNEFVGPTSLYKSETQDTAAATFHVAHDTCWNRGGHLPRSTELGELIQQGLPNGSAGWLWTSDQEGYNGTQFLVGIVSWTGVNRRFGHLYSTYKSWAYKHETPGRPYRCIYYPIDSSFTGPNDTTQCNGGCQVFAVGSGPARMWLDKFDRTPTTMGSAANICMRAGGHLASERDFTEAIRHGLANGSGVGANWIHTSDLEWGESGLYNGIVHWAGVDANYNDLHSTYSTWGGLTDTRPYRCMWTNELR